MDGGAICVVPTVSQAFLCDLRDAGGPLSPAD